MPTNADKATFTGKKLKAAFMLADGGKTQVEICECIGINETTLSRWKRDPDYIAYVDKLTLENELASRAGMLRALYQGAKIKADQVYGDKSTHLDYMKEIGNVQGLKTQKVEHSGEVAQNVVVYLPGNDRDELPNSKADVKQLVEPEDDHDTTA